MAKPQKYKVVLSEKNRAKLEEITKRGKTSARVLKRVEILLKADQSTGRYLKDEQIAKMLDISKGTVQNVRENYCKIGLKCLHDAPRPGRPSLIDGEIEAKIVTIACSEPPQGREKWTIRMIAERLVELECLEDISHQGVYKRLKKMNLNLG
jgi:transposase